jgi:hypothetical protein
VSVASSELGPQPTPPRASVPPHTIGLRGGGGGRHSLAGDGVEGAYSDD